MAGFRAGVALHAVVHARFQHGQAGPVVFLGKELAHTGQELVHQLLFFSRAFRHWNVQSANLIENAGGVFLLGVCKGLPRHRLDVKRQNGQIFNVDSLDRKSVV